jgi:hypothetical protein
VALKGSFDSQQNAFGKYMMIVPVRCRQVLIADLLGKENSHFFIPDGDFEKRLFATQSTKVV